MADVFKATPEQFNAHANQFKSYFTNMQNAYLKISNEVRTLGGNWTGEAAMTFQSQFDSMYKVLETTEKGMMQVVTELQQAAGLIEETESKHESMANALDEGTSPFSS